MPKIRTKPMVKEDTTYKVDPKSLKSLRELYESYQIRFSHLGITIEIRYRPEEGHSSHSWIPATSACTNLQEAVNDAINNYGEI